MGTDERKEYENDRTKWLEWKGTVGELLAYKSEKTKYEQKRFFEKVEQAVG